jgi:RNA polymerase sigma factor (TIGR02999 family)
VRLVSREQHDPIDPFHPHPRRASRPDRVTLRPPDDAHAALLKELRGGGREALDHAVTLLYDELREIAHRLRVRRRGPTVDTLTLVHETYLKLADQAEPKWNDRAHFLALAAVVMRHVLTDRARAQFASKREGDRIAVPIDEIALASSNQSGAVLEVADALDRLELVDARLARVVEYRFFGGLTNDEIALVLDVDERTVRRDWARAQTLLRASLGP